MKRLIIRLFSILLFFTSNSETFSQQPDWELTPNMGGGWIGTLVAGSDGIIYAGVAGAVFMSDDDGNNWVDISAGISYLDSVFSIGVGPEGTLFVGMSSLNKYTDGNGWLIRTDNNGDSLWTRTFGDTLTDSFHPVKELSNGDFIIGGFSQKPGKGDEAWLVRTDDYGNLLWEKTYGGIGGDRVYDIEETKDGGIIVLAWTRSFGSGEHDIWLLRTDANGDSLWSKFYGGELSDVAFSFHRTHDNGLIFSGFTKSYRNGQSDAWILKITPSLPVSEIITKSEWIDIDRDGSSEGLLDGTESYNPDYEIISYIWTIHDSVIGTSAQITASLPVGLNQVNLTVSDENGFASSSTKEITVVLGKSKKIFLHQNFPNPFNPATLIKYEIPYEAKVEITIYNLLGERVVTLVSGLQKAGDYKVTWNAINMASGVYVYRLRAIPTSVGRAGDFVRTRKMVLLK